MKQKIFQIVVITCFFIWFWYFFGDEFWEYQNSQMQENEYQQTIEQEIESFSLQDINELWDVELVVTPNLELLTRLVEQIDNAQQRVYLEAYIFTERDMRDAMMRANQRWVDVKILLENNPYKAPYLNDSHYNDLKVAWVDVRWSDPLNYSLNHSKLLIIDDKAYVSTWNFSYSLFKHNRDFLISLWNKDILESLLTLFESDFYHQNVWVYHPNLVLSPDYSRSKIYSLVASAEQKIDFYFPYLADDAFREVLFQRSRDGISIRWIVGKDFYQDNIEMVELYGSNDIKLFPINSWKLHAKSIIVDNKQAYVGSINFSTFSFDENREIWLLLQDKNVIEKLLQTFNSDL